MKISKKACLKGIKRLAGKDREFPLFSFEQISYNAPEKTKRRRSAFPVGLVFCPEDFMRNPPLGFGKNNQGYFEF
jgi:hypothetical protein